MRARAVWAVELRPLKDGSRQVGVRAIRNHYQKHSPVLKKGGGVYSKIWFLFLFMHSSPAVQSLWTLPPPVAIAGHDRSPACNHNYVPW